MTAEESTESTSRTNSPSQKKITSVVVVKSPEKLEPVDLGRQHSNLDNGQAKTNAKHNQQEITNFTTILLNDQHSNSNN